MTRDATLHDVANRVGVSPRTVSRVVKDEGGFSEATRKRVLAAVEELGYRPNMLARGLITRRSGTIGLVGGYMTDPFFPALAEGVQHKARQSGRTMFFASTSMDVERQAQVLDTLWSHAVDGVIVFPADDSIDQLADYSRRGLRLVVVDDLVESPNLACVCFDLGTGAREAVRHLAGRGRSQIAMIASTTSPPRRRRRERGFIEASKQAGYDEPPLIRTAPTLEGGEAGARELLHQHPHLDGIVAYNDLVAIGAMRHIQTTGRNVPDDIAIVGFDDIETSGLVSPSLTTIRLDHDRLSDEVTQALNDLIDSPCTRRDPVVVPVELIVREST